MNLQALMSLLLGRRVWIVLLAYCLLFSCKIKTGDDGVSGLIQPKNQVQSTFFADTFSLKTSTVLYNNVSSGISRRLLVGTYEDVKGFGNVTAKGYAQFTIGQTFATFGPDPVLDSIVMLVYIGATIPGVSTISSPYKYGELGAAPGSIAFHRLSISILDTTYTTASSANYDSEPLGVLGPFNSFPAAASIPYRITLNNALGLEFMANVNNFSSSDTFKDMFKGLAVIGDNSAVIGIEDIRIRLYYHNYFALNNLKVADSLDIYQNDYFYANPVHKFTEISVDRSGSPLAKLQQNYDEISSTETAKNACYVQAYTGVGTKVQFPFIDNFINSKTSKILINRADLVIKPDVTLEANKADEPLPPYIMAYELDSEGHVQIVSTTTGAGTLLQSETSAGIFGTARPLIIPYDLTNQEYRITMTSYIQALVDKNIHMPNNGLLIVGTDDIELSAYYYANINKMIFYNDKNSPYCIKLYVHYSEYK